MRQCEYCRRTTGGTEEECKGCGAPLDNGVMRTMYDVMGDYTSYSCAPVSCVTYASLSSARDFQNIVQNQILSRQFRRM